ncbi:YcxB family protein [Cellulosimicrobium cellulans]|uniref:YcxB family protein n=1 Tax=Cellulosimicrobium cellulans TaxID=1710 RepID=UPI00130E89C0|nr:YcxB family protein [Cellulosimicrobium cellulans]
MTGAAAPPTLTLEWRPERTELAEALRALMRLRRGRRTAALLVGGLGVAAGAWALGQPVLSWLPVVAVAAALVLLPMHRLAACLVWRRDPRQHDEHTAQVAPGSGVTLTIGDVTSTFRWSAFSGVLETDRLYLLTLPRGRRTSVLPLPRRAAEPDDARALRAVLTAELGEPVRVR